MFSSFFFLSLFNQTSATRLWQLLSLSPYFISNIEWAINLAIICNSKTIPTADKNTTRFVILTHHWRLEWFQVWRFEQELHHKFVFQQKKTNSARIDGSIVGIRILNCLSPCQKNLYSLISSSRLRLVFCATFWE